MKKYKPTTPARRQMSVVPFKELLTTSKPHKALIVGFKRGVGRNHHGRITTRHKGGGHKRSYRLIDFKFDKKNIPAKVETIEYDPNRSGFIALICYVDGERRYIIAPKTIEVGSMIIASETAEIKIGNRLPLFKIPLGTQIYNLEIKPGNGAKLIRSAGNFAEVVAKDAGYVNVKLPSGEIRKFIETAWASIGVVSNDAHKLRVIGNAGKMRHLGIRPTVSGNSMNPVDHPMGGGEAHSRGQRKHKKSPWGKWVDPGIKTRTPKKYSNVFIVQRRKNKKRK